MKSLKPIAYSIFILLTILLIGVVDGRAQTPNQAGLVVEFGDGSLFTACIDFEGENISGYDLLARSGLSLETAFDPSQGVAVCKIEADGCPADDCFCQMPEYWSYWNLGGGGWIYAGSGASTNRLSNGDVDGWSWGAGNPPPVMAFNQLCAPPPPPPPTPSETLEPQPSDTPEPEPTDTPEPQPSDTPEPEPTDTFIPPTYTKIPSSTPEPGSPTPSPTVSQPSATSTLKTEASQAKLQDADAIPSPISTSTKAGDIEAPAPTRTETEQITSKPDTKEGNNNNELVGYAVFGALLIGLGLALTRIILKGRKP